jgi:hypothetical protein
MFMHFFLASLWQGRNGEGNCDINILLAPRYLPLPTDPPSNCTRPAKRTSDWPFSLGAFCPPKVETDVVDGAAALLLAPPQFFFLLAHVVHTDRTLRLHCFLLRVLNVESAVGGGFVFGVQVLGEGLARHVGVVQHLPYVVRESMFSRLG